MDAIAAEAGVSKLTVYSHFTDKETLFAFAVKSKCEQQIPELLFELPAGVPIETMVAQGEGHGFYKPENRAELYKRMEAFLSRHIGAGAK